MKLTSILYSTAMGTLIVSSMYGCAFPPSQNKEAKPNAESSGKPTHSGTDADHHAHDAGPSTQPTPIPSPQAPKANDDNSNASGSSATDAKPPVPIPNSKPSLEPSPVSGDPSPPPSPSPSPSPTPQIPQPIQVAWSYGDKARGTLSLVFDEKEGIFRLQLEFTPISWMAILGSMMIFDSALTRKKIPLIVKKGGGRTKKCLKYWPTQLQTLSKDFPIARSSFRGC